MKAVQSIGEEKYPSDLTENKLNIYNEVLKEQAGDLEAEIYSLIPILDTKPGPALVFFRKPRPF